MTLTLSTRHRCRKHIQATSQLQFPFCCLKKDKKWIFCSILLSYTWKCIKSILDDEIYNHHTLMQEERRGDKSFFIFSRRIPYIFSTKAASCCLKSKAGYFASICCTTSIPLLERLLDERKLCETPLYFIFEINVIEISLNYQMDFLEFIYQFIHTFPMN